MGKRGRRDLDFLNGEVLELLEQESGVEPAAND
jgi:hypothetical protein